MRALLRLETNGGKAGRWDLTPGQVLRIGRSEENEARPDCHGLSRRHSEVDYRDGAWIVRDLGSTNGTWHNDHRIAPNGEETLAEGDRVRAGAAVFVFERVQPRFRLCPVCGDGQVYAENALLANGLARPGVLVCGRCGTVIREADGQFGVVFVPWAYARQRRRLGAEMFTAQELEMFGEAALDEGSDDDGAPDGAGVPQDAADSPDEAAFMVDAPRSEPAHGGARQAVTEMAPAAPKTAAGRPAPAPARAAPEPEPESETEMEAESEALGPSAVELALASLERAFAASARASRGKSR